MTSMDSWPMQQPMLQAVSAGATPSTTSPEKTCAARRAVHYTGIEQIYHFVHSEHNRVGSSPEHHQDDDDDETWAVESDTGKLIFHMPFSRVGLMKATDCKPCRSLGCRDADKFDLNLLDCLLSGFASIMLALHVAICIKDSKVSLCWLRGFRNVLSGRHGRPVQVRCCAQCQRSSRLP